MVGQLATVNIFGQDNVQFAGTSITVTLNISFLISHPSGTSSVVTNDYDSDFVLNPIIISGLKNHFQISYDFVFFSTADNEPKVIGNDQIILYLKEERLALHCIICVDLTDNAKM